MQGVTGRFDQWAASAHGWLRCSRTVCASGLHRLVPFVGCAAGKLGRGFNTSAGPACRGGGAARSRRIKKIESGILRLDASIRSIDAEMTDKGFDVGALLQLQAQRDEVSSKIEAFIAERERLEAQPWALCAGGPDGLPEESSQDTEQGRTREAEEVEAQLPPRPLPPLVDPDGRKGRVVLNHSTSAPTFARFVKGVSAAIIC